MPADTFESDRPRHERMAGAAKLDTYRPWRIGQAQASPVPAVRAYARRLIGYMAVEERDMAQAGYREIPSSVRRELEAEDRERPWVNEFAPLNKGEALYVAAKKRAATGEAGRMLIIQTGSPHALSLYLERWRDKRGEKPQPLEAGEGDRIHAEILEDMRGEGLR